MGGSIEENLEETRAKKMIDLCRKCFNSYVKVKKKLEVSSQSFNIAIYIFSNFTTGHPPEFEQGS